MCDLKAAHHHFNIQILISVHRTKKAPYEALCREGNKRPERGFRLSRREVTPHDDMTPQSSE